MRVVLHIPIVLSALLLGAHFLRAGNLIALALSLVFPFLLLFRTLWAKRTVQALLAMSALVWVHVASELIEFRLFLGMPWARLAVIMGAVVLLTVGAALALETRWLRPIYPRRSSCEPR